MLLFRLDSFLTHYTSFPFRVKVSLKINMNCLTSSFLWQKVRERKWKGRGMMLCPEFQNPVEHELLKDKELLLLSANEIGSSLGRIRPIQGNAIMVTLNPSLSTWRMDAWNFLLPIRSFPYFSHLIKTPLAGNSSPFTLNYPTNSITFTCDTIKITDPINNIYKGRQSFL